jgi:Lamin Tail Domain
MRRIHLPRLAALWVLLPALALGAPACSDDDGGACDDVVNACDTLDAVTCMGNTAQTCTENADGCLEWTDTEVCGTGDTCTDGECVCSNECATGDSQCDGNMIQLCAMGADGCYDWADETDCADSDESCDDTSDAICVTGAGCGNDEREGTEICDGDDLDDQNCEDEDFGPGTLACNDTCDGYITTGCSAAADCGNDTIESPEVCDGSDLASQDCTDHGFDEGTLDCATNCGAFDTSSCTYFDPGITCAAATDISSVTFPFTLAGTFDDDPTVGFTCDATPTNVVWYEYTPTVTGNYVINAATTDTWAYAQLAITETNACDPYGAEVACVLGDDYYLSTGVALTSGVTYLIALFTDDEAFLMTDPEIDILPPIAGDSCGDTVDLSSATFPHSLTGTFPHDPATGFSCDTDPTNVVWYEFTPSTTGIYTFDATNNTTDDAYAGMVVLDGASCAPYDTELFCTLTQEKFASDSDLLTAGNTYLIAFFTDADEYSMVDPTITITSTAVGPGDDCPAPIDLTSVTFPHQVTGEFVVDPSTGFSCYGAPTNVVWYQYTAPTTGTYDITATNNTTTDAWAGMVVLDGTGCATYDTELDCSTYSGTSAGSTVTFTAGSTYLIAFFTDENYYTMVDPTITIAMHSHTVNWCGLHHPTTVTATEGATEMAYGRLYIPGLTDLTTGADPSSSIIGEVGVGTDGSDPTTDFASWTWFPTVVNPGFTDNSNDEYMGPLTMLAAANSPYDMAFRFSGDAGATWTYCDTTDNPYTIADAGEMISTAAPGTLIISEYIEGSSFNKALEFFNASGINLDLGTCEVRRYNNGNTTPTGTYNFPTQYLAIDETFVVCHNQAGAALNAYCDDNATSATDFTGDDSLELYCGGVLVDSIGQVGTDPGSSWGTTPTTTQNDTLRRTGTITFGDTDSSDAYDPTTEWTGFAQDTFDGLGTHP